MERIQCETIIINNKIYIEKFACSKQVWAVDQNGSNCGPIRRSQTESSAGFENFSQFWNGEPGIQSCVFIYKSSLKNLKFSSLLKTSV